MRNQRRDEFVVKNVEAIVSLAVAIAGVCVWSYSTFATKEQVQTLVVLIESNKKDAQAQIEGNKRDTQEMIRQMQTGVERMQLQFNQSIIEAKSELKEFSNKNRQGMDEGFASLKEMFLDLKEEVRSGSIKPHLNSRKLFRGE